MPLNKWEVRLAYTGYVTVDVEAKDKNEAWDKAQEEIKTKEFILDDYTGLDRFSNNQIADFLDSLERWDEADQVNEIEEG